MEKKTKRGAKDDEDTDDDVVDVVAGSAIGLGSYELTTFSHGIHVCPGQK